VVLVVLLLRRVKMEVLEAIRLLLVHLLPKTHQALELILLKRMAAGAVQLGTERMVKMVGRAVAVRLRVV
jgi:hypothetical protein